MINDLNSDKKISWCTHLSQLGRFGGEGKLVVRHFRRTRRWTSHRRCSTSTPTSVAISIREDLVVGPIPEPIRELGTTPPSEALLGGRTTTSGTGVRLPFAGPAAMTAMFESVLLCPG